MLIFIRSENQATFGLDVEDKDTISSLKATIGDCLSLPVSSFHVLFNDEVLSSGTLSDHNISVECTVSIVEIKEGGESSTPTTSSSADSPVPPSSLSTLSSDNNNNNKDDVTKASIMSSFSASPSGVVEVVFSFDTTGSMSTCIQEVRKKLKDTAERLIRDIPKIKIGFIAHGDYCDFSNYVIEKIDLTNDVPALLSWIDGVGSTGGGDAPEAYEYALREAARSFSWSSESAKALVVIGDCEPHPPSYTTLRINWWDELDALIDLGVKVYGVQAFTNENSRPFYEELSERSGTVSIQFNHFHLIVDMFLAICYRESGKEKLKQFEESHKREGNMSSEMSKIFNTLALPDRVIDRSQPRRPHGTKSLAAWYTFERDDQLKPLYEYHEKEKRWTQIGGKPADVKYAK
eukprot:TRINITY_DN10233_c0_g3_i1.p1 TRINITY_DN10233_c0_g3~~TRINITY_DN10233_c0_g3_i1.p1  ORF type:complete len:405 (+),score=99.60 TRINITY_DN10233_c0_g3_i1:78-1292(+)